MLIQWDTDDTGNVCKVYSADTAISFFFNLGTQKHDLI